MADNRIEGGLGSIDDSDFGSDGTIDDSATSDSDNSDSADSNDESGVDDPVKGSPEGSTDPKNPNQIGGGLGDIEEDDFSGGVIEDDTDAGGNQRTDSNDGTPKPSNPNQIPGGIENLDDSDFSGGVVEGDVDAGGSGSGSDSGSNPNNTSPKSGQSTQPSQTGSASSGPSDTPSKQTGSGQSATESPTSQQSGATLDGLDGLPDKFGRAGRVEGGLSGLSFDQSGTAIIEETPDEQGLESSLGFGDEFQQKKSAIVAENSATRDSSLTGDDVRVVENYQGELTLDPTESFERKVEQRQAASNPFGDPADYEADVDQDFSVDQVGLTEEGKQNVREEFASGTPYSPQQVQIDRQQTQQGTQLQIGPTESAVRQRATDQLEQEIEQQTELNATPGEDFTVKRSGDQFVANLTEEFRRSVAQARREELRNARAKTSTPASPGVATQSNQTPLLLGNLQAGGSTTQPQSQDIQSTAASTSTSPAVQKQEQPERFGDVGAVFGVEPDDALRDVGQLYSKYVTRTTARAAGSVVEGSVEAAGDATSAVLPGKNKGIRQATDAAGTLLGRKVAQPATSGAVGLLNVPKTTAGLIEAGEFLGKAAETTALGDAIEGTQLVDGPADQGRDIDEYAGQATKAGTAAVQQGIKYAQQNPVKTASALGGSLIASAGLIGAASRVSSTAGRASALAVQPGEELVGYAGNRALSAVPKVGTRLAGATFPDNEPVIFSEEAALRIAKAAARKARSAGDLVRGEARLSPSPRQSALIELGRPGSNTGTFSADAETDRGVLGATSEPLGSDTESILDATTTEAREGIQDPSDTASAIDEFLADTRAQLELAQEQRQQPDTDPATEPEIDPSRRRDDLLEGSPRDQLSSDITRRQQEMLRQAEGTFEGEQDPLKGGEQRRDAATEPEARLDEEAGIRRAEAATPQSDSLTLNDTLGGSRSGGLFDNVLDIDVGVDARTDADQITETVQETAIETETEAEQELEQERERKRDFETEAKSEFQTESQAELFREPGEEEPQPSEAGGPSGFTSRDQGAGYTLTSGYLNEYVTALGTEGGARTAPSQSKLKQAAEDRVSTQALPTVKQLQGDEGVEAAEDLFSGLDFGNGDGLL